MTHFTDYYIYLKQRSGTGLIYRRYWLYPKLMRNVRGSVLDFGCGIGDFLKYCPNSVGVDVNPLTVDYCKKQGLSAQLIENDRLPFQSNSFDSVVMDNVLEHISDPKLVLLELYRVLSNNGTIIVGVPGKMGFDADPDHKIFYTRELLIETLSKYGFRDERIFGMPVNFDKFGDLIKQYCIYGVFVKE